MKIYYKDFVDGKIHFTKGRLVGKKKLKNPFGLLVNYYIIERKSSILYIPEYCFIGKNYESF
jgi:hypothetical protein